MKSQDVFSLVATSTTMGSGTSVANAAVVLEGTDVGLDSGQEKPDGITLAE